jgi:alpha-galactosidase
MRRLVCLATLSVTAWCLIAVATASALDNGVALTPPLGWNSWNAYACNDTAGTIEAAAAAIHGSAVPGSAPAPGSLQSLGYDYVNSDGCWNDLVGEGTPDPRGNATYYAGKNPSSPPAEACNVVNGRLPGPNGPGTGQIFINPYEFPPSSTSASVGYWTPTQADACLNDGLEVVANYVHSLGLKFGLWADDGNNWNCEEIPGSYGFDATDASTFASWGVDYLKGDWGCSDSSVDPFTGIAGLGSFDANDPSTAQTMYTALSNALQGTGRSIVFAADGAGITPATDPWLLTDGPSLLNQIRPVSSSASFSNLLSIVNTDIPYADQYDQPGFFVDPDIMEVGNTTRSGGPALGTANGDQAEQSLFSELSMPLLTSTPLGGTGTGCTSFGTPASYSGPTLPSIPFYTPPTSAADSMYSSYSTTSFTPPKDTTPGQGVPCQLTSHLSSVFGNADVVSVDQDPLDQAGHVVSSATGQLILAKPLANGDVSVVLFNEDTTAPATMSTTASAVGLPSAPAYTLQDLWSKSAVQTTGAISETVPAGGVVMLRVAPASVDTDCSSLTSGSTVGGNLKIPAGSFCQLNGVTVNGNVNVGAGGYLSATGGHIAGSVISQGGDVLLASTSVGGNVTSQQSAVQLRGADVTGNVQLSQATGEAVVCGATVGGNLEVQNAAAHTDLCSNSVTGNLTVRNNNGPVWVTDNTTTANLQCSNDSPEAISNGNSVGAQELGECTH